MSTRREIPCHLVGGPHEHVPADQLARMQAQAGNLGTAELSRAAEAYVLDHAERRFPTLDYYKQFT